MINKNILSAFHISFCHMMWKLYDRLYLLTGCEHFYYPDEQAVHNEAVVRGSPICCNLPFNFILPFEQEPGNEYFIVCDHSSRFKCTKAAKISFYRPEYVENDFYLGKKRWILSQQEKINLMAFLQDNTSFYTDCKSWFESLIKTYNYEAPFYSRENKSYPIPTSLKMPDYTKLS